MGASWDMLLPELLNLILDRLTVLDYLRFAAVCSFWQRVQRDHRHLGGGPSACMPWLMLPVIKEKPQSCRFYCPSDHRYYQLSLPVAAQGQHLGNSHGWTAFLNKEMELLVLLNPFTGDEIHIAFPSSNYENNYVCLGSLSSSPKDRDCVVLLHVSDTPAMGFYCLVREKKWMSWISSPDHLSIVPCIIGGKFHVCREILCREIFELSISLQVMDEPFSVPVHTCFDMTSLPYIFGEYAKDLVESDGQLLLVCFAFDGYSVCINIFEADLSQKVWVKLESLGNRVLYIGPLHSVIMPAVETDGPGNRIYFICDLNHFEPSMWIEYDYGTREQIRSTEKWNFEEYVCSFGHEFSSWIVPNLC